MRLILVRHAESAGNAAGIIQGQAEFPLSPRGERQAELLARRLAEGPLLNALYSSPLQRAHATACSIAAATGLAVRALPDAKEYDFGEANGMAIAEVRERFGGGDRPVGAERRYPGEEGRGAFRERVCAAFFGLGQTGVDETIAVVSHAGPISAFCTAILGMEYSGRTPFPIHNASITVIDVHGGRGVIHGINDICHLDGEDGG